MYTNIIPSISTHSNHILQQKLHLVTGKIPCTGNFHQSHGNFQISVNIPSQFRKRIFCTVIPRKYPSLIGLHYLLILLTCGKFHHNAEGCRDSCPLKVFIEYKISTFHSIDLWKIPAAECSSALENSITQIILAVDIHGKFHSTFHKVHGVMMPH